MPEKSEPKSPAEPQKEEPDGTQAEQSEPSEKTEKSEKVEKPEKVEKQERSGPPRRPGPAGPGPDVSSPRGCGVSTSSRSTADGGCDSRCTDSMGHGDADQLRGASLGRARRPTSLSRQELQEIRAALRERDGMIEDQKRRIVQQDTALQELIELVSEQSNALANFTRSRNPGSRRSPDGTRRASRAGCRPGSTTPQPPVSEDGGPPSGAQPGALKERSDAMKNDLGKQGAATPAGGSLGQQQKQQHGILKSEGDSREHGALEAADQSASGRRPPRAAAAASAPPGGQDMPMDPRLPGSGVPSSISTVSQPGGSGRWRGEVGNSGVRGSGRGSEKRAVISDLVEEARVDPPSPASGEPQQQQHPVPPTGDGPSTSATTQATRESREKTEEPRSSVRTSVATGAAAGPMHPSQSAPLSGAVAAAPGPSRLARVAGFLEPPGGDAPSIVVSHNILCCVQ
eukprot:TRINITY_DN6208_c0_g1_i2.p1 TRINITY_DN6208_c0_g1~~TRINITY_DN6208_c0_g1_i2.p1  ORF type:complete len:486 (+),score=46.85 TRINITY_DN6208_c0_g1_i2:90-1460(+)